MKIVRTYALPEKAVNVKLILQQIIELNIENKVNTNAVNPSTSHTKITLGGDCA